MVSAIGISKSEYISETVWFRLVSSSVPAEDRFAFLMNSIKSSARNATSWLSLFLLLDFFLRFLGGSTSLSLSSMMTDNDFGV